MTNIEIIEKLNETCENTLNSTLQIEYTEVNLEEGWLKAKMPVNARVHQPMGRLHGGATMALAETVGSAGSLLFIDAKTKFVVGIEINGNHLKGIETGWVIATGKIVHLGKSTHLWEIRIENENNELISLCKLTNMVISRKIHE